MRLKLPLLRARYIPPARAPILRYGVAVLSITLALIPALMMADLVESRLVVFAVAIMVSAWYAGLDKTTGVPHLSAPGQSFFFLFCGCRAPRQCLGILT